MCQFGVQCVNLGYNVSIWGCNHTEHLASWVNGNVVAATPFDSLPFQDNFAIHRLIRVLRRFCATRRGECSACARVGHGASSHILPFPVNDATLRGHLIIILFACGRVHFGIVGVTTAFTLPAYIPTQGQTLEVSRGRRCREDTPVFGFPVFARCKPLGVRF